MSKSVLPSKKKRIFLKENFAIEQWEAIKPYYDDLLNRKINAKEDLKKWFRDRSELESALSEDLGWRYIRMTGDTANKEYADKFNYFIAEIQPHVAPYSHKLNEKALLNPFFKDVKLERGYDVLSRLIEKDFKIFREENIPLITEVEQAAHQFGSISGAMTVQMEDKELTLQQAADYLQGNDREKREEAYLKIAERRLQDRKTLDDLFTKLLKLRHEIALNAGFKNYRDYMFTALGRFDYSAEDCFNFHEAVEREVVPVLHELASERKAALGVDTLRPWDLSINYFGTDPLKPFNDGEELLNKSIECFNEIHECPAKCLLKMKEMGHLDLVSRKGKAPGGYNYPLEETGVPFIFMNATTSLRDLVTMVHEGGHALHSFLTADLELNSFKNPPSEVAELASMSMELISMEHWHIYFKEEKDLKRAKREHLEGIIQTLAWVAVVDKFQHWLYEHPDHSESERKNAWKEIFGKFSDRITDWTGLEKYKDYGWQKQLHIFEVPFYYIEYAIAQLGAVAVWKNYKSDPERGFEKYLDALRLGYTKPVKEIYQAAGIRFDFSGDYIKDLTDFVKQELRNCIPV
jgi:oligoendopeptidase F